MTRAEMANVSDSDIAPVTTIQFVYPNGKPGQDYGSSHVDIAKELGFDAAVETHWGEADYDSYHYQLPRFTSWDQGRVRN